YEPEGQDILAQNFNRVHDASVKAKYADRFPEVRLVTVQNVFGGWDKASQEHFAEGGKLDKIFVNRCRPNILRHHRAWPGDPRVPSVLVASTVNTWMPGPRPGMTHFGADNACPHPAAIA